MITSNRIIVNSIMISIISVSVITIIICSIVGTADAQPKLKKPTAAISRGFAVMSLEGTRGVPRNGGRK